MFESLTRKCKWLDQRTHQEICLTRSRRRSTKRKAKIENSETVPAVKNKAPCSVREQAWFGSMPVLEEEEAKTMATSLCTSPTITWSPWRWSFSKHTKWRTRERRRKSIDQNSRLFLFYRAFYLSFRYYELGSTLRTGSNHSCAIVLRLSRA